MRKYLSLIGSTLSIFAPACAFAQTAIPAGPQPIADDEITVLGTGGWQRVEEAGQSISVLGADELDDLQTPDLTAALERLPGITFTRNGGMGSFTGVRVRGAGAEQLLVLVDGIRVADVAAPGGGYDFGTLASSGIGKIELLRGSNSVVWGSEAIGGVMALSSRSYDGVEASAEYGSRDSVNAQVGGGLSRDRYDVSLNAGYTRTDGFSTAASGTEKDGFRQYRANGKAQVKVTQALSAVFAGRYADSRLDFDGFSFSPPYGLIDTPEYSDITEWSGRAGLEYSARTLHLDAGYAIYDIDRANYNPDYGAQDLTFASKGRQQRVEMMGRIGAREGLRVDFGADHEWERFSTTYDARKTANSTSGHALLGWSGDRLSVAAGARIDDHSGFGSEWTFGANGAVDLGEGWRVRASYGEGFKAPTLYQLYSDYGDDALRPERSRSYDIGIERGTRNDRLHLAATLFRRDSRNLIDFASCVGDQCTTRPFGLYQNVGRARAEGVEIELGARVTDRFRAQAAYSYVKATNRTDGDANRGNALARRPRHAVTASIDWESPVGLMVGGDVRMVSDSFDDAGNFTPLDGYALATVRAEMPITEALALYGRVENVTDTNYQTAAGYGTAGRSAFVGARARF